MNQHFPAPGELFAGRYTITSLIGKGGFSRVYHATQPASPHQVALKVMLPPAAKGMAPREQQMFNDQLVERFRREAKMIRQLSSPHTITLHDFGETDSGLLYMSLEYIDGENLAQLCLREGKVRPDLVMTVLQQVLQSLGEAHELGVLHRDVKPLNIMVTKKLGKAHVKLLDFGIAKMLGTGERQVTEITEAGTLIGTARYMAPEQILGETLGPFTDIYSLGLVAYELLTGRAAVRDSDSIRVIGKQLAPQSFELPAGLVSDTFRNIINRMLRKRVDERYNAVEEVLADLAKIETVDEETVIRLGDDAVEIVAEAAQLLSGVDEDAVPTLEVDKYIKENDPWPSVETPVSMDPDGDEDGEEPTGQYDPELANKPTTELEQPGWQEPDTEPPQLGDDTGSLFASGPPRALMIAVVVASLFLLASLALLTVTLITSTADDEPNPAHTAAVESGQADLLAIDTDPAGAIITVNGQSAGASPLTVDKTNLTWPVRVVATHDGASVERMIADPDVDRIILELQTPSAATDERDDEATDEPESGDELAKAPKKDAGGQDDDSTTEEDPPKAKDERTKPAANPPPRRRGGARRGRNTPKNRRGGTRRGNKPTFRPLDL